MINIIYKILFPVLPIYVGNFNLIKYAWRNDYSFEKLRDFEFAKEEIYIDDCLT